MGKSDYIKTLGNRQLSIHYEGTYQKLDDIKQEIIENITDLLGKNPEIDMKTYLDAKKFLTYYKPYETGINEENKELFKILMRKEQDIQEEIIIRQREMLKEIGIIAPSIRVQMILERTRGGNFGMFDVMIEYVKLEQEGKGDTRPENRTIYAPPDLIEVFEEKLGNTILDILAENAGPIQN